MVRAAKKSRKNYFLIGSAIAVLLTIAGFVFIRAKLQKHLTDNLPVWLLRDGRVAVYREVEITKGNLTKRIVVKNLSEEDQKNIKIYEAIPKEVAQKASQLTFSITPEIIEDDPLIMWDLGDLSQPSKTDEKQGIILSIIKGGTMGAMGVCDTKDAKEWIRMHYPMAFSVISCGEYVAHLEKVVQERTSGEWQNKTDENKISRVIESSDSQYSSIKKEAKAIIKKEAQKPKANLFSKKLTKEEAIKKVFEKFPDILKGKGETKDCVCDGVYDEGKKEWHIICTRPAYKPAQYPGRIYYAFYYITVNDKGKIYEQGRDEGYQECPVGSLYCKYSEMKPDSPWKN